MKNKTTISILILCAGLSTYLILNSGIKTKPVKNTEKNEEKQGQQQKTTSDSASQANEPEFDYMALLSESERAHIQDTGYVLTKEDIERLKRKKQRKDMQELLPTVEELEKMVVTPVEFYGQVLDQFDQPVIGAEIICYWAYFGSQDSPRKIQSDAAGKFQIIDMIAYSISVSVNPPPGYDEQIRDSKDVMIAKTPERVLTNENYKKLSPELKLELEGKIGREEAYKGDKTKPVIFRLKKL